MTKNGIHVDDVSKERNEPEGLVDMVLEGASEMVQRNIEGVDTVVIVVLMADGSGHLCSAPTLGADLPPLLEALAAGLRES
jgi:hypothetical protein